MYRYAILWSRLLQGKECLLVLKFQLRTQNTDSVFVYIFRTRNVRKSQIFPRCKQKYVGSLRVSACVYCRMFCLFEHILQHIWHYGTYSPWVTKAAHVFSDFQRVWRRTLQQSCEFLNSGAVPYQYVHKFKERERETTLSSSAFDRTQRGACANCIPALHEYSGGWVNQSLLVVAVSHLHTMSGYTEHKTRGLSELLSLLALHIYIVGWNRHLLVAIFHHHTMFRRTSQQVVINQSQQPHPLRPNPW